MDPKSRRVGAAMAQRGCNETQVQSTDKSDSPLNSVWAGIEPVMNCLISLHVFGPMLLCGILLMMPRPLGAADDYFVISSTQAGGPVYQWVDITLDGEEVIPSGNTGKADITPEVPLLIHGDVYGKRFGSGLPITVSINGYVDGLQSSGADITPACPLPDNAGSRLLGYHADLRISTVADRDPAGVFHRYFHQSPHPHSPGGLHVFTWQRVLRQDGQGGEFTFQILSFDNGDVLMQYQTAVPAGAGFFTIGTQVDSFDDGDFASTYAARGTMTLVGGGTMPCIIGDLPPAQHAVLYRLHSTQIGSAAQLALVINGGKFTFAPALNGQTLALTEAIRYRELGNAAIIFDATALPDGVALDGQSIVFEMAPLSGAATPASVDARLAPPLFSFHNITFDSGGRHMDLNDSSALLYSHCRLLGHGALMRSEDRWHESVFDAVTGELTYDAPRQFVRAAMHLRDTIISGFGTGIQFEDLLGGFSMRDCAVSQGGGALMSARLGNASGAEILRCTFTDVNTVVDLLEDQLGINTLTSPLSSLRVEDCEFVRTATSSLPSRHIYFDTGAAAVAFRRCTSENRLPNTETVLLRDVDAQNIALPEVVMEHCTLANTRLEAHRNRTYALRHCTLSRGTNDPFFTAQIAPSPGNAVLLQNCILTGGASTAPVTANNVVISTASNYNTFPGTPAGLGLANLFNTDAALLPLAYNGGLTRTMKPVRSSRAVEAGDPAITGGLDQRGQPRVQNGDGLGAARVDIGAVELGPPVPLIVTTAVDELAVPGSGLSLREAVQEAGADDVITFDPALNGAVFSLPLGSLTIGGSMEIDASSLAAGITLSAASTVDLMTVSQQASLKLTHLHFTAGRRALVLANAAQITVEDATFSGLTAGGRNGAVVSAADDAVIQMRRTMVKDCSALNGGALYTNARARVSLTDCWLQGNSAVSGGAVRLGNDSGFIAERCLFSRNTAYGGPGGAVYLARLAHVSAMSSSTLGENHSEGGGGALHLNGGALEMKYSTVHRNTGGGIGGNADAVQYFHCILAGNEASGSKSNTTGGLSAGWNLTDSNEAVFSATTDRLLTAPRLSPLGWHGGAIPCYAPLAGSAAINGGAGFNISLPAADQRGFPRVDDDTSDIGAVEVLAPLVVTTAVDQSNTPAGAELSLREAIRDCPDGGRITFAPALNGAVLNITSQVQFDSKAISIEATDLPRGITVSRGGGASRVFNIQNNAALSLHAVSSTGGAASLSGGGIRNAGRLMMTRASVYGNAGDSGGGILHTGLSMTLENCTLSGNTAATGGGALASSGTGLRIAHCTIANNTSTAGACGISLTGAPLFLTHTILSGNRRASVLDNYAADAASVLTSGGNNLEDGNELPTGTLDFHNTFANLLPLTFQEGYSLTHALLSNSPARNAGSATASALGGTDQRGFPRTAGGVIDTGAFEAGGYSDWILSLTPAGADRRFEGDADGDGLPNGLEYLADLSPTLQDSGNALNSFVLNPGLTVSRRATFRYRVDRTDALLSVEATPDLRVWQTLFTARGVDPPPPHTPPLTGVSDSAIIPNVLHTTNLQFNVSSANLSVTPPLFLRFRSILVP